MSERFGTLVVGGGQAGLAVGYHLARLKSSFVILEANQSVGHCWGERFVGRDAEHVAKHIAGRAGSAARAPRGRVRELSRRPRVTSP